MEVRNIKEQKEQYIRINNNHIFIQADGSTWLDNMKNIMTKHNQRIHIFEIYPMDVLTMFEAIIHDVYDDCKVIIHIPRTMKDWSIVINDYLANNLYIRDKTNWKVITERRMTRFSYYDNGYMKHFIVSYDVDIRNQFIHSYVEQQTYMIGRGSYELSKDVRAIMTMPQLKFPNLFRDTIIKQFKKSTPPNILESFISDDDIWEYIVDEWKLDINDKENDDE